MFKRFTRKQTLQELFHGQFLTYQWTDVKSSVFIALYGLTLLPDLMCTPFSMAGHGQQEAATNLAALRLPISETLE